MITCCYGCGQKASFGSNEKPRCSENVSCCPAIKAKIASKAKNNQNRVGTKNKLPHPSKGKTYTEMYGLKKGKKQAEKVSKALQGFDYTEHMTEEALKAHKKHLSNVINKRYEDGWQAKGGRCKKLVYDSQIAGQVNLDGTWELEVAKYLDKLGVKWKRNKSRFAYTFEGVERFYTPDFFVEDHDCYLEVKGYETEKDRSKWSQFDHKLILLKKDEIKAIKRGDDVLGWK